MGCEPGLLGQIALQLGSPSYVLNAAPSPGGHFKSELQQAGYMEWEFAGTRAQQVWSFSEVTLWSLCGADTTSGLEMTNKRAEDMVSIWVNPFKHCLLQKTQRIELHRKCALKNINTMYNKTPTLFMRDNLSIVSSTWLVLLHSAFWTIILELIFH